MEDGVRKRLRWLHLHKELGDAGRVCLRCGISRPTLRKWLRGYATSGLDGLLEQSRRPNHSPGRKVTPKAQSEPLCAFVLSWLTVVMLAVAAITAVFFRSERWGFLIVPLTFISGMLLTVALAGATFARLNEDDGPFGTLLAVIGGVVLAVVGTGIGRFIGKARFKERQSCLAMVTSCEHKSVKFI